MSASGRGRDGVGRGREREREKSVQSRPPIRWKYYRDSVGCGWARSSLCRGASGDDVHGFAGFVSGAQEARQGRSRSGRSVHPVPRAVRVLSGFLFLPRAVNVNMYVSRADGAAAVVGRHRGVTLEGWMLGNLGFGGGPAGVPSVPFGPSHSGGGCPESCPALCLVSAAPPLAVRGFPHPLRTGPGHGVRGASEARDRPFHRPEAPPYRPRPPSRLGRPTGCHPWALHSGVPLQDPHPRATG